MKVKVKTLENKAAGEIDLNDDIFAVPVRKDILARVIQWQRDKKRAGTHKTKGISEISGTGKKPFKQKGTGSARQGSLRSPQFRGGATIFGPVVRSHATSLPKKVRALGLKCALSDKAASGKLHVVDGLGETAKTKALGQSFEKIGVGKVLIIDATPSEAFVKAARNLKGVNVLPVVGANVYDIIRHHDLLITKEAVKQLEARLK